MRQQQTKKPRIWREKQLPLSTLLKTNSYFLGVHWLLHLSETKALQLDISPLDLLPKILHDAKILAKSSQVVEKELLIQEKEKLYMELKQILARQPGPEVAEQLSIYQQTLKEKTKQMKGMSSELNMYEAQVKEYKYEIERLAKELQEVKKKFYMQKRKEQQAR